MTFDFTYVNLKYDILVIVSDSPLGLGMLSLFGNLMRGACGRTA